MSHQTFFFLSLNAFYIYIVFISDVVIFHPYATMIQSILHSIAQNNKHKYRVCENFANIYSVKNVEIKSVKFMVKNCQLYGMVYGCNVLGFYGFNLNLQLKKCISLTDIMLIYQPAEVLKSVL